MPDVVAIRHADDPRDIIHRAVQHLTAGSLVVLPTETVYVLVCSALAENAVTRLRELSDEAASTPPYLAVKDGVEARDYVPQPSQIGLRLMRRSWPGPVTLSFADVQALGVVGSLPATTREAITPGGNLRMRAPGSEIIHEILHLMPCPLVVAGEHLQENRVAVTATELPPGWMNASDYVIDADATRYGIPATEVQVEGEHWSIVVPGVLSERSIARLCSQVYLFVCTGNTCRSPMAEGLFRKILSERLECREDELIDRGFVVASAGLAATLGAPASPESVDLLHRTGIDLRAHESQPLTRHLLEQSDRVFAMTRNHREMILAERPDVQDRVCLLAQDDTDICDPMGGTLADYEACRDEIERHVRMIVDKLDLNQKPSS